MFDCSGKEQSCANCGFMCAVTASGAICNVNKILSDVFSPSDVILAVQVGYRGLFLSHSI